MIEATAQDWFNYIARGTTSNAQIQYIAEVSGSIDYTTLQKAVEATLQAEPILSCIFATSDKPTWRTAEHSKICSRVATTDTQSAIDAFLSQDLNPSLEPPLKVCLIGNEKPHVLAIKISHAVCDGSGSKHYLKLLADAYTALAKGNKSVADLTCHRRDSAAFYNALGITNIEKHFDPSKLDLASTWGMAANDISAEQHFECQLLTFAPDELLRIKQFAKARNASVNTALMVLYSKALAQLTGNKTAQAEIQFMADLRKFIDEEQTICNLSAIVNVTIDNESEFGTTVGKTQKMVEQLIAPMNLVQSAIGCDLSASQGFFAANEFMRADWENIQTTGLCSPMISNLGVIDSSIAFGTNTTESITMISPAFYGPAFLLGASTFLGKLTLCASYFAPSIDRKHVAKLLQLIHEAFEKHIG